MKHLGSAISAALSFLTILTISQLNFSCSPGVVKKHEVLAFYTGKNDAAHVSFVKEASSWFKKISDSLDLSFDTTNNWSRLKSCKPGKPDIIVFFDTRPEDASDREAFRKYMDEGGAWIGFHFAAFALTPSDFPQNWDWYHLDFLGSGQYVSNTWRPTPAILKVENKEHPALKDIPARFTASPNEWYRWEKDLTQNKNIEILCSIDTSSYPLGTGPKLHEIWHEGYYPVVWTNRNYRMIYINMGHNDIDYDNKTNRELSFTFRNTIQDKLVINALQWLISPTDKPGKNDKK